MERQFVATAYIIEDNQALLVYHKKLQKWLPPGGHIDPNETPQEAARREAFEETGLEVELISHDPIWVEDENAVSLERPYMCLLEEIPEYKDVPAHQHIDFIFLSRPVKGTLTHNEQESEDIRWFTLDEIQTLPSMYNETRQVLLQLLEPVGV